MSFLPPGGGADKRRRRTERPSATPDEATTAEQDASQQDTSQTDESATADREDTGPSSNADGGQTDRAAGGSDGPGGEGEDQGEGETDTFGRFFPAAKEAPSRMERRRASLTATHGVGRAVGITALGLIPGLGLSMTRRRQIGFALLAVTLIGLVAFTVYLVRRDAFSRVGAINMLTSWVAQPNLLRVIWAGLLIGGLIWVGSVVLTAVTARPRPMTGGQRSILVVFTVAMCALILLPVTRAAYYIDVTESEVGQIFQPPSASGDGEGDGPQPGRPDVSAADPWEHVDRVNLLLIGSDSGDSRDGVRPDSMIMVSVDTQTGDAVMIGIPRNLQNAPIPASIPLFQAYPEGFTCGAECLINGIWTAAEEHAEQNPQWYAGDDNPGLTATREVVAAVVGQPIHHTVLANLEGFSDLVNAMGGIDITVQERLPMGGQVYDSDGGIYMVPGSESGWLEPGYQHLDGYEALWYARSRVTSDDFSRMRRQRCVVGAIVEQVDPITMLSRYDQIVRAAGDNIRVDISVTELSAWAVLIERIQSGSMRSQPLTPQNVNVGNPNYNAIHLMVTEALQPPEPEPEPDPTSSPTPTDATTSPAEEIDDTETETAEPEPTDDEPTGIPTADDLEDIGAVC